MNKLMIGAALSVLSLAAHAQDFRLTSSGMQQGRQIDNVYVQNGSGCAGGDTSPPLAWSGAPAGTKSFAITVYDPDAPTGSGWWHWTVVNIPKHVRSLPADAGNRNGVNIPAGAVQGRTDFGSPGYGGPCPPAGDPAHHYHFKVWALKVERLPVTGETSGAMVGYLLNVNSLAAAELIATSITQK